MQRSHLPVRDAIHRELEANRAAFHTLLAGISDAELLRPSANPAWSIGALLHHIVAGLEHLPREVRAARRGRNVKRMPRWLYDALNARRTRREAAGQTCDKLRERYDAAHRAALDALDGVRDDEWRQRLHFYYLEATVERLFLRQSEHLAEHAVDILRAGDRR